MKTINHIVKRIFQIAVVATVVSPISAQTVKINVDDALFTQPLIEKLVEEYQKVEPAFKAQIVNGDVVSDASISISNDAKNVIARYFILPVANSEAQILSEKKVQKGINQKVAKELFVERTVDEQLDNPDKKQLPGTVYTLSGKHSELTNLLAESLDVLVKDIRGKKVLGREENLISVIKKRPDAISVDVASLVYDHKTRKPIEGIAVLPVDLDGNNKVSDEERDALGDLDLLTTFLDTSSNALPTGNVGINSDNASVKRFVSWASTYGQKYLASFGYLKTFNDYTAQK